MVCLERGDTAHPHVRLHRMNFRLCFFALCPPQELIADEIDSIRSTPGPASVSLRKPAEHPVFSAAIPMRQNDWEIHQPVCDTVVTVYDASFSGTETAEANDGEDEISLRAAIYCPKLASYTGITITGFEDLRQVKIVADLVYCGPVCIRTSS